MIRKVEKNHKNLINREIKEFTVCTDKNLTGKVVGEKSRNRTDKNLDSKININ